MILPFIAGGIVAAGIYEWWRKNHPKLDTNLDVRTLHAVQFAISKVISPLNTAEKARESKRLSLFSKSLLPDFPLASKALQAKANRL